MELEESIRRNIENTIKNTKDYMIPDLAEKLIECKQENILKDYFGMMIQFCNSQCVYQLVKVVKQVEGIEQVIEQYSKQIIEKCSPGGLPLLIRDLKELDNFGETVKENLSYIVEKCANIYIPELVEDLQEIVGSKEVAKYTKELINKCHTPKTAFLMEELNKYEETKKELKKYRKDAETKIIECFTGMSKKQLEEEKIYDFVRTVFKEVCENEHEDLLNIKQIGAGQFAKVYQIGEKVIKFEYRREKRNIPYHKRILQPAVFQPINSIEERKGDKPLFYIEVAEKVENYKEANITVKDGRAIGRTI